MTHTVIMCTLVADIFSTFKSLPFTGMRNQINNYLYAAFLIIEEIFDQYLNIFLCDKSNICRLEIITHRSNIVRSPKLIWAPCAQLYSLAETPPPPPRIWAHIRGRYWSAKIDDISL